MQTSGCRCIGAPRLSAAVGSSQAAAPLLLPAGAPLPPGCPLPPAFQVLTLVAAPLHLSLCLQYLTNEQLLIHDLVSCWWIALKHCSIRTAVPNRCGGGGACSACGACEAHSLHGTPVPPSSAYPLR